MKVFVVGAGPVATAVAGALHRANAESGTTSVSGIWARRPEQAKAAAELAEVPWYSGRAFAELAEAEVVIVAVRDDAMQEVMGVMDHALQPHHILLHCSGSRSAKQAFGSFAGQVDGVATMHPLRSIADGAVAMRSFGGTVFGVEGSEQGKSVARELVQVLQGEVLELKEEQMAAYHAAAVLMSNYFVSLTDASLEVLKEANLDSNKALPGLLSLAHGALTNIAESGVEAGLTGPIRRGDKETVSKHLEALQPSSESLRALYRVLGQRTVEVARRTDVASSEDLDAIEEKLKTFG